ncbi:UNVERIFIED_CONTAM: hypothetical protein RMT77_002784 [Armadillidium vulgare]
MSFLRELNMKFFLPVHRLLKAVGILLIMCSYTSKNICLANQINFAVNPNCSIDCDKPWLIYGKREGENNTVHYLWSAMELPSFVVAVSVPEAEIQVNWTELQEGKPGAIYFSKVPESTFGISFQTLILFNDRNDTGKIDNIPEGDKNYASLSDFEWNVSPSENVTGQTKFTFSSTIYKGKKMANDSQISFSVVAYDENGRGESLPHLITKPSSFQIEIVLNNLFIDFNTYNGHGYRNYGTDDDVIPISGFYYPRWAVDTIVVSDDLPKEDGDRGFHMENDKSLDDEYTPGVFDLSTITTEGARESSGDLMGGYLQWRPVCYLTSDKDINFSTYPNLNNSLPPIDLEHIGNANRSLFYVLFGNNINNLIGFQTSVAFGLSKDGFYTKYNYTEWTFSMGLGAVPEESFSTLIIIIISVAVAIPALLFIFGAAYLVIRKLTRGRGQVLITEE